MKKGLHLHRHLDKTAASNTARSKTTARRKYTTVDSKAAKHAHDVGALANNLHSISRKLSLMSGASRSDKSESSMLRARDELIVALHETVETQGQQLLAKEAEIRGYCERIQEYQDEEETVFALVDSVEKSEAELKAAQAANARLQQQCLAHHNHGETLAEQVASLQWQLRVAVPDIALRQLLAEQAKVALTQKHPLEHDGAPGRKVSHIERQVAECDAHHRRTFLTAARELARLDAEVESLRCESFQALHLREWVLYASSSYNNTHMTGLCRSR
eukprot:COSAG05_NODE_462_length_9561_cov_5.923378_2_plen_275_part_00